MASRSPARRALPWLLLIPVGWASYRVLSQLAEAGSQPQAITSLLLPLSIVLVVLAAALAGVLIRNLVRLVIERKRGILGSRLRTKLVFFFLALVLLPATILFVGSAQVIKQTVEAILPTPQDIAQKSKAVLEQSGEYFEGLAGRQAAALAAELRESRAPETEGPEALAERLRQWCRRHPADLVWVGRGAVRLAGVDPDPGILPTADRLLRELWPRLAAGSAPLTGSEHSGHELLALAVAGVEGGEAGGSWVAVGIVMPRELVGSLEGIQEAGSKYRAFRAKRGDLVRLYVSLIGVVFLLTLFVAVWIGFYLSRRITGPLQELAQATREISAGNLDVRVNTRVGDEVGMLVDAFNEMAGQLQESREVIVRSEADLRRSYQVLEERRRYIETLLANLSTGVVSLDPAGKVTTVNPAAREILGVALSAGDDAVARCAAAGLDALVELLGTAHELRGEGVRRALSIPPRSLVVQLSPLRGGGGTNLGALLMVEDLSDLLRAQRTAAWREVAQRIAHEIKNPLTPIQLAAQRLRKKFAERAGDLERVVPEATSAIEREVATLKQMVDEFSRFARMPEIEPRPVEFSKVVDSVLALYHAQPGIRWEVQLAPDVGEVTLDAAQMRRVLINLIDNAIRAMEGQGVIGVTACRADGALHVEVADSGPGIPAGDRERLFAPRFSTSPRGTGLGLAIVHRVITDHRGTIRVEDNAPRGARFVIEVPA
ncbi:MAG TPA: ATP-binding protein [Candidatus Polarisedimenticolaceae bacterium]|nr:ATP-binding protein [Candidatus Polarisedimenticolaceae bacterium]